MKRWLEDNLLRLNLTDIMEHPNGFTRLSYSAEEWQARQQFIDLAKELELIITEDQAGNVIARWNPNGMEMDSPAVALGSHVDTVANGGGYDGVAGVLCGLGAVYQLKKSGFTPKHPIEIINFASEESARFGVSTIGSKAMSGQFNVDKFASVEDKLGVTIQQAMEERGLNYQESPSAERPKNALLSFTELHIEQGMRIEKAKADYGVVTAVACPIRLHIFIEGKAGHTGTTPMTERNDALVYAAEIIRFINDKALELDRASEVPLVATVSTINLEPNVMNVIPNHVKLGVDIRSVSDDLKQKLFEAIVNKSTEMQATFQVTIKVSTLVNSPSIHLDKTLQEELVQSGEQVKLKSLTLDSGAGHDAMNMQYKWPSGLVFIPCKDGLSHHPEEHTSLDDLENGVKLLANFLKNKAGD